MSESFWRYTTLFEDFFLFFVSSQMVLGFFGFFSIPTAFAHTKAYDFVEFFEMTNGNQRFGGHWRCHQLTIYYVFSCWAAANPVPSNGLSGTGIMLYVGGNTMHCNFWCGRFAMLLPGHGAFRKPPMQNCNAKNCPGKNVKSLQKIGKWSRIDTWFKIVYMTSRFASDICVCASVPAKKNFNSIWSLHNFEGLATYDFHA